jgi:hypothetical protein
MPVESQDKVDALIRAIYIKASLLSEGIRVDPSITGLMPYKLRVEHLYRHDWGHPLDFPYPQEIILFSDPVLTQNHPIIVNLRSNPFSRWRLRAVHHVPILVTPGGKPLQVALQPAPPFYSAETAAGTKVWRIAQQLGCDLVGVIPHNYCFFFAGKQECIFCEITTNYADSRTYYQVGKPIREIVASLCLALQPENQIKCLVLTSGNHRTNDETARLYIDIMYRVSHSPQRAGAFVFGSLMAPESFYLIDKLKEAGFDAIAFNLEAWHPEIFARIAPGKAAYGRQRMLDALAYAVQVFGQGYVYSNLVYGVQSLDDGLNPESLDLKRETELSLEADAELLRAGVVPLHTVYHSTGKNRIGPLTLNSQSVFDFYIAYGELVYQSGVIPHDRMGVLFNLGSISNHLYNDSWMIARARSATAAET